MCHLLSEHLDEILIALRKKSLTLDQNPPKDFNPNQAFRDHSNSIIRGAFNDIAIICGESLLNCASQSDSTMTVWEELNDSLQSSRPAVPEQCEALYRRALNQRWLIHTVLRNCTNDEGTSIGRSPVRPPMDLTTLASLDPESCCAVLDTLAEIMFATHPTRSVYKITLLTQVKHLVLKPYDNEVKATAQTILAKAFRNEELKEAFNETVTERDVFKMIRELDFHCLGLPPSNGQAALSLQGNLLEYAYTKYGHISHDLSSVDLQSMSRSYPYDVSDEPPTDSKMLVRRENLFSYIAKYIRLLRFTMIDTNVS